MSELQDIYIQLLDSYNRILLSSGYLDFEDIFYYAYKIFSEGYKLPNFTQNYINIYN